MLLPRRELRGIIFNFFLIFFRFRVKRYTVVAAPLTDRWWIARDRQGRDFRVTGIAFDKSDDSGSRKCRRTGAARRENNRTVVHVKRWIRCHCGRRRRRHRPARSSSSARAYRGTRYCCYIDVSRAATTPPRGTYPTPLWRTTLSSAPPPRRFYRRESPR